MTIARTSRSASSLANTSGISDQNAGPIALPLPGPISVTCATWSLVSTVTDSYGAPMTPQASPLRRRGTHQHLAHRAVGQEFTHGACDRLGELGSQRAERVVFLLVENRFH